MGISGGNFFVAETGSVVLVTNEGNATLTTTLPKVHVAISGIEKIVPTLEDVATLMRLLPRSATGQSISNYVDILTGAKGEGEFHGAEHMYFILVDSGRTGVLASDVREALRCIRCGACMNHCPVYQNVGGHSYGWVYPGPIGSILTPMYVGLENAQDLPQASTLCNQCGVVCPVKIPLPDLQRKLREKRSSAACGRGTSAPACELWSWFAQRPRALRRCVAASACAMLRWHGADSDGMIRRLPFGGGWTDERDMPAPAGRTFRELYRSATHGRQCADERAAYAPHLPVPRLSRRAESLGTENAFVVLAEVNALVRSGQGHRFVLHRPAGLPDAAATSRTPRSPRSRARRSTATRRRRASTSCARPRRSDIGARRGLDIRARTTSSSARARSRSSPTRSRRSPTTARATK